MGHVHIGCQAITWGDRIGERLSEILPAIAAAGYEGTEIGFRHLVSVDPGETKEHLSAHGLQLVASHLGGNLEDIDQAASEKGKIDSVLDYMEVTGTRLLMYSGLRFESDEQFQHDIGMICRAAQRCADRGVTLLYHNHNWEFDNDSLVMNRLLDAAPAELGFCPDVGWVAKAGIPVVDWLETIRDRIGAVHFKDFATLAPGMDTVELGKGVVPLTDIARWIRDAFDDIWVIAEQDVADVPAAEAAQENARFMAAAFA